MSVFRQTTADFYKYSISDAVEYNVQRWLQYGLLEMGAYTNVDSGHEGYILQRTKDERYSDGQVYEGLGPSWVWESGMNVPSGLDDPIVASGVVVDSVFYESDSSEYPHSIDFRNGRVIFDSALSSSSIVQCDYCFSDVGVYTSDTPQWRIIVDDYFSKFLTLGTDQPYGLAQILKEKRVWLPCVVIQAPDRGHRGLQLGGGEWAKIRVICHIFSDIPQSAKSLTDIISDQNRKKLTLFDINSAPFPFNTDGSLVTSPLDYPSLISSYELHPVYMDNAESRFPREFGGLFRGEVTFATELMRNNY